MYVQETNNKLTKQKFKQNIKKIPKRTKSTTTRTKITKQL